ncbi:MAG: ABC transporter ATP-binding protein [Deltaproteobacteria bacterium]|nr:ABC transporter ATP-binding protein [Deltaproteobacteria bacterium]
MPATPRSFDDGDARIVKVRGRRLVKTFGSTAALRGVDVELEPGLNLIEGANGSGKTTLLRILGTMLQPTSGEVVHEPFAGDLARVRRSLGWLSHEPLSYGDLSGRANLELAAELLGLDPRCTWQRVEARFELGRFAERPVRTMSRGQRQRVALARALCHSPSFLLLDEPTTGLDRAGVARLLEVMSEEVSRGAIVALVTHEPRLFDAQVTRRIVLERGMLVAGT